MSPTTTISGWPLRGVLTGLRGSRAEGGDAHQQRASVQPRRPEQIQLGFMRRDPVIDRFAPLLTTGLKQLNWVAGRIVEQNLRTARSGHDLVAEIHASSA